ncbi:acyl carrier protein [Anaeromicropila populeti]|uniref:Phosphopantetheine attachment site n=1 Tax=Anaeromicropila populeti TaxID=37658 RepID=A0A1I6HTA0_9FIRM|nr:phosphopantetheine-binding protein [Anaeromicropila populeti]SFR57480.1 Phosphopantetheine attachment site [Anaeromicropila populeti]
MQENDVTEFVLNLVNEMALDSNITVQSNIKADVNIDSIGWLRCLIRLEEKYQCSFSPEFLIDNSINTIQDFIDKINRYLATK